MWKTDTERGDFAQGHHVLTFHLLLGRFDVRHHARHVHTIPVQVLEEDVRVSPGERACL